MPDSRLPDPKVTGSAFKRPVQRMLPLTVGALGIVYGDIGTSPLYSIRETFAEVHRVPVTRSSILGVLSLIFWSLIVVITIKYVIVVLRADNHGEGGILALTALVAPTDEARQRRNRLVLAGLFGAALLYGDGAITPAISVLSAVEGMEVAAPGLSRFVVPTAIAILIVLFSIQRRGSEAVGRFFGPVMVVWFAVLAVLGIVHVVDHPSVLAAVNPVYGVRFFVEFTSRAFIALGGVVLVVTGGEALYADLGHFGKVPIKRGWFFVVLPALLLNYFGQGALLLADPEAVRSPFFLLAPEWAIYPLVGLATLATVIASQALISGVFSLTHQAIQLGFTPRMEVRHTSAAAHGQVYLPLVNWVLLAACVGLVWGFGSSANLAGAYGIAVTATMLITSILIGVFATEHWQWSRRKVVGVIGAFLLIDLAFLGGNLIKIPHGGWFTLVAAALVFYVMTTWRTGRRMMSVKLKRAQQPMKALINSITRSQIRRIEGTGVYLFPTPGHVPPAFLANLRHNQAVHESVVFLAVTTAEMPRVPRARREQVTHLGSRFYQVILRYGFMEEPDVPTELRQIMAEVAFDPLHTTYFLGKEHLISNSEEGINGFRERLFNFMHRNARSAADYFKLPVDRVIEIGIPVEI
jgi:KUP system potassium uptake protein